MTSLRAIFRAALAAIKTMAWRVVQVGGKLVLSLVQVPASGAEHPVEGAEDLVGGAPEASAPPPGNRYQLIRRLAAQIDDAPVNDIEKVGVAVAMWLAALSPLMVAKVLFATDEELADHLAGRRTISGLLRCEAGTVADYVRATTASNSALTPNEEVYLAPAY